MVDDDQPMKTARDFDPGVLALFDQYVHGMIDRRGFLEGAARYAAGGLTAVGLLEALSPRFAQAQKVPPTDAGVQAEYREFSSPKGNGKGRGYLVVPARARPDAKLPTILVIHENRGLNPHIEDIARRLALDGFVAFAPDELFSQGGYPGDEDRARALFAQVDTAKAVEDFIAACQVLRSHPRSNGKLGAVGFCWGGGIVNRLATRLPDLAAGVPFYGPAPDLAAVPTIKARLLLQFAGNDERINAGWPAYEAALKAAHVRYDAFVYPGVEHGFNNDTTPRYDAKAAELAWQRTIAFFNRSLNT